MVEGLDFKTKEEKDLFFIDFYRRFSKYVFRKVSNRVFVKEDAKDLTSDIFAIIYQNLDNIKSEEALFKYLLTVINRTVNRKSINYNDFQEIDNQVESKHYYLIDESFDILDGLDELDRKLIILKIVYEYTFREISAYLKISLGNVHKMYNEAVEKLHKILRGKE